MELSYEGIGQVAATFATQETEEAPLAIGHAVKVYDMEFDEEDTYTLVGFTEADPAKLFISGESPIGKALIGAKVGDIVDVETHSGVFKYKILDIDRSN